MKCSTLLSQILHMYDMSYVFWWHVQNISFNGIEINQTKKKDKSYVKWMSVTELLFETKGALD